MYDCPYHRVALKLEVIVLSPMGRALSNIERVSFYRCPVVDPKAVVKKRRKNPTQVKGHVIDGIKYDTEGRCMFMKPNKWQKHPIKQKEFTRTNAIASEGNKRGLI